MLYGGEPRRGRSTDALRGRFGGDELGMRLLERLQLAHEGVVGLVADGRPIEDVVLVVRFLDLLAEISDAPLYA